MDVKIDQINHQSINFRFGIELSISFSHCLSLLIKYTSKCTDSLDNKDLVQQQRLMPHRPPKPDYLE